MNKWIKYKLIRRPWVDGNGKVLDSIEGRQNRPGVDEFSGGGYDYPDETDKIDRIERKGTLLLLVEESKVESMLAINNKFNGVAPSKPLEEIKLLYPNEDITLDNDLKIIWPKAEVLNNG